jgi:transposase
MKTASKLSMTLLPKFPGLKFEDVFIDAENVSLRVASARPEAKCPVCGCESGRLHSHYPRTVADLPWGGRSVKLSLRVRRFRCPTSSCPRKIFAERLPPVVEPYARKTTRLRETLLLVGFALGGEAGARLAGRLVSMIAQ